MSKTFRFFADIAFEAESAEAAARRLADHLTWISDSFSNRDVSEPEPWFRGAIQLHPEGDE